MATFPTVAEKYSVSLFAPVWQFVFSQSALRTSHFVLRVSRSRFAVRGLAVRVFTSPSFALRPRFAVCSSQFALRSNCRMVYLRNWLIVVVVVIGVTCLLERFAMQMILFSWHHVHLLSE